MVLGGWGREIIEEDLNEMGIGLIGVEIDLGLKVIKMEYDVGGI